MGGYPIDYSSITPMGGYAIDYLVESGYMAYPWTHTLLANVLHRQRSTLRELRVEQLATQDGLDSFSLHDFINLETFQCCIQGRPNPEEASRIWATPTLKTLVLEYTDHDSQHGKYYFFLPNDIEWLDDFARSVVKKSKYMDAGLECIEISPTEESHWNPWSGLDGRQTALIFENAKLAVEKHGIKFKYLQCTV
ncbi:hypothetical protein BT63DRAFT_419322 [Microthyrium microscopicum]|uniref:Uncharacterized protein n=1 Tax=Microthyrium microscopicum TaxID=703497 RepID=A0A6A6UP34_9PEZI|nr:hypothetical protein BT63DRAFT_419322 [Microthyrium microscopicum]